MFVLGKQFAPHFVFGQDYLLYFWWQELFARAPPSHLPTSPCPYPYYFVFLFFIVCSIRFGFLARFCMKYFTLFPYTLHLTLAHTLVLTWPIVFRCPCCLMQLNTHGQHTRILRYKGCLCECAIDAASLMYYPKKRNVCIAYAGF